MNSWIFNFVLLFENMSNKLSWLIEWNHRVQNITLTLIFHVKQCKHIASINRDQRANSTEDNVLHMKSCFVMHEWWRSSKESKSFSKILKIKEIYIQFFNHQTRKNFRGYIVNKVPNAMNHMFVFVSRGRMWYSSSIEET